MSNNNSLQIQTRNTAKKSETRAKQLAIASTQKNTASSGSRVTNLVKGGTITVEMLAFIPKRLGAPISDILNAKDVRDQTGLNARLKIITGTFAKEPFSTGSSSIHHRMPLEQIEQTTPWYFATDDRDFGGGSYRLGMKNITPIQIADIGRIFSRSPSLKKSLFQVSCSESKRVRAIFTGLADTETGMKWNQWKVMEERKTAVTHGKQQLNEEMKDSFTYSASAHAVYPFASETFAPDIHMDIDLKFRRDSSNGKAYIDISGQHNQFPFYEILINSRSVYTYESKDDGPGFWNLSLLKSFDKVVVLG